ncbi:MAG: Mur ligase family protein, partial [Candidatus Berkiellales bacterium]
MTQKNCHAVVGLGATGLSVIQFLTQQGFPVVAMDTREDPPNAAEFRQKYPHIPLYTAQWPEEVLEGATIVVSPGVSILLPALTRAKAKGAEIIGDIELFARFNQIPVIAITGSNGKSTVTSLVGEMARVAGKKVAVIGNIGTPVLNLFNEPHAHYDLVVMELSSFQLETTYSLQPLVATVLNITPDHLDRY